MIGQRCNDLESLPTTFGGGCAKCFVIARCGPVPMNSGRKPAVPLIAILNFGLKRNGRPKKIEGKIDRRRLPQLAINAHVCGPDHAGDARPSHKERAHKPRLRVSSVLVQHESSNDVARLRATTTGQTVVCPLDMERVVAYLSVSTQRQHRSGLGLDAQRAAIQRFTEAESLSIITEFVEAETGKGADALERRPKLAAALARPKREVQRSCCQARPPVPRCCLRCRPDGAKGAVH